MFPRGETMYTVADLIEHLKWSDPTNIVRLIESESSDGMYLSMDGRTTHETTLLFAPRHQFNDIRVYLECSKCGSCYLESYDGICHHHDCNGRLDIVDKDLGDHLFSKTSLY